MKAIAAGLDAMLVVGAPNSSNSRRLVEVAERAGAKQAFLVQRASEINWPALEGASKVGLTAGASAPQVLVEEIIEAFKARFEVTVELPDTPDEGVHFKVPRLLSDVEAAE